METLRFFLLVFLWAACLAGGILLLKIFRMFQVSAEKRTPGDARSLRRNRLRLLAFEVVVVILILILTLWN